MRNAPPVRLPLGRADRLARAGGARALGSARAGVAAWIGLRAGLVSDASVALLAALACGAGVALSSWYGRAGRPRAATRLRWNGEGWRLLLGDIGGEGVDGTLRATIDLGDWMLLRFDATGRLPSGVARTSWWAVGRADHPERWHPLRCAVYCPRPDAGPAITVDTALV